MRSLQLLFPITIVFLIYPNDSAAQQDMRDSSAPIIARGVASDAEASKRIRLSAEQGNAWAQYMLGLSCLQGKGVSQD